MSTLRLEAELRDAPSIQRVVRLQAVLGAGNAELLRNALDLLDWCVSQVRLGRQIASVSETGVTREFTMPILERAREQNRIMVSASAFSQITHLLDNPPEPTAALRVLMATASPVGARKQKTSKRGSRKPR